MQEFMSHLPSRSAIPKTALYTRIYTDNDIPIESSNRDVIILVPGGPGNDCTMYDTPEQSIAIHFSPFVDVVLFDPRGCGKSQPSSLEYCTLEHYIDDIEAIRKHLSILPKRLIVFGQSYGSIAALGYAIRYSENLKKLLLVSAIASSEFIEQAKSDLECRGTNEQKIMADKIWSGSFQNSNDLAEFCRVMGPLYSFSYTHKEGAELSIPCTIDILNYGWRVFLKSFDFRDKMGDIKCQVLILWGENEWLMGKLQVEEVHKLIPHSKLITYKECGHMLWLDQWEDFTRDSIRFLVL